MSRHRPVRPHTKFTATSKVSLFFSPRNKTKKLLSWPSFHCQLHVHFQLYSQLSWSQFSPPSYSNFDSLPSGKSLSDVQCLCQWQSRESLTWHWDCSLLFSLKDNRTHLAGEKSSRRSKPSLMFKLCAREKNCVFSFSNNADVTLTPK